MLKPMVYSIAFAKVTESNTKNYYQLYSLFYFIISRIAFVFQFLDIDSYMQAYSYYVISIFRIDYVYLNIKAHMFLHGTVKWSLDGKRLDVWTSRS